MTAQGLLVSFSCTSITAACVSSSLLVSDLNGKSTLQHSELQVSLSLSLPSDFVSGRSVTIDGANSTSVKISLLHGKSPDTSNPFVILDGCAVPLLFKANHKLSLFFLGCFSSTCPETSLHTS